MNNLRKILLFFFCWILLVNLTSCFYAIDPGPYLGNQDDLYTLAKYNIPGAPGSENASIEVVEKDTYGRILFRFSCRSSFYHDASNSLPDESTVNLRAYAICQKSLHGAVYYMENVCYLTRKSWDDFTDDVLAAFKQANMWNEEPTEGKWSVCNVNKTPEFDYPSEEELVAISGGSNKNINIHYDVVSKDAHGRTLIFVREIYSPDVNQNEYYKSYIVISNENGEFCKEFSTEIVDFYHHTDELCALKEKAGWTPTIRQD